MSTKWIVDASHSLVEFSVKHMMIATVKGRFAEVQGAITADPAHLTGAQFEGTVNVASIDTRDAGRDEHLRSADFFDAAQFPTITFRTAQVESKGGDDYQVTGELTMHGVTKPVTFKGSFEGQGKDPWGNERLGFSLETKVNRKDFNLNWNVALEAGGVLVSEDVKISLALEAVKQA